MASIYEVNAWVSGGGDHLPYAKNDIVERLGKFYYNVVDIPTSAQNIAPESTSQNNIYWGGHTSFDGKEIPHFFWIPSYSPVTTNEPSIKTVKFGDGYEQRTPQHINANLISLNLKFAARDEKEATAIAHFLNSRNGAEAFAFLPPSPYETIKKCICKKWDVVMTFENNFEISASFDEVVE